jgi:hypothetical protein
MVTLQRALISAHSDTPPGIRGKGGRMGQTDSNAIYLLVHECVYICTCCSTFQGTSHTSPTVHVNVTMFFLLSLAYWSAIAAALPAESINDLQSVHDKRAGTCTRSIPSPPDGSYEYPHLIIPVSKSSPETCYPNDYYAFMTPNDKATIFNFDVIETDQSCELGFFFPTQDQLETSSFSFDGPGTFTFDISDTGSYAVDGTTRWNAQPQSAVLTGFPKTINMQPGNYYPILIGPCKVGTWSLTMSSPDTSFSWFQDYNPCAIGPFSMYTGPTVTDGPYGGVP